MSNKVVILSQFMYPERNSTGELLSSLASGLVSAGFEVTAYCAQPSYFGTESKVARHLVWKGVDIRRVWSTRFGRRRVAGRLFDSLTFVAAMLTHMPRLPQDAVVLVVSNPPVLPLVAAIVRLVGGARFAVLIHDLYPEIAVELGVIRPGGLLHRILKQLDKLVLSQADSVVVLGRDMRARLLAKWSSGFSHGIHVIPNWADPSISQLPKLDSRAARASGLLERFVVQYSGNVGKSQNLEVILQAAELLREHGVVFTVVGGGVRLQHLQQKVAARQLPNVLFFPRLEWHDLSDSLAACDIAIVPLQGGLEGLSVPSKYYTILASGRPVVAVMAPDAEVAQSINENDCGSVVPAGDFRQLAEIILDYKSRPLRLLEHARNARNAFERLYTRETAINSYVELFTELFADVTLNPASTPWRRNPKFIASWVALVLLAASAWVVAVSHLIVLIVIVSLIVLPMLWLIRAMRFPFVVIGGLTILSSSNSLSGAKLFYLAGVSLALAAALAHIAGHGTSGVYVRLRPLLIVSSLWFVAICFSLFVALSHGNAITDWLRDSAPYLLICSVPFLVFDAYGTAALPVLPLFILTSTAAVLSFTVFILSRRIVVPLPIDHIVLPSPLLPAALYCFAVSRALLETRYRLAWGVVGMTLLGFFLASGTRTYVVLLLAPLVIVLVNAKARLRLLGLVTLAGGAAVVLLLLFYGVRSLAGLHGPTLVDRLLTIPQFLSHPSADMSYQERVSQARVAWDAFVSQPLLGVGPGHWFTWRFPDGTAVRTFTLDTTLSYLAKFGLVGVGFLIAVVAAWGVTVRRLTDDVRSSVVRSAFISYAVITLSLFPLAAPLEDKGLSFGLMFLLLLASEPLQASRGQGVGDPTFAPALLTEAASPGATHLR